MVADIEMADRPYDDPDYMKDAIQNIIDDGSSVLYGLQRDHAR